MKQVYKSRLTKRRTKAEMVQLRTDLYDIVRKNRPVTIRQAFYLAVSAGLVEKTESVYKNVIVRILSAMRLKGDMPWRWIVDFSRTFRKRSSQNSVREALEDCARLYRKNVWHDLDERVEVWTEKETLSGVLLEETWDLDVGLYPCRGYPSLSFLHSAALAIEDSERPTFIYYFGDHDPSGTDIPRTIQERLSEFAPDAEIYFKRLAIIPDQIETWNLPTRPTKSTDSRAENFKGDSIEVEAIPPATLRKLCREAIESHLLEGWLDKIKVIEESEQKSISMFAADKRIKH